MEKSLILALILHDTVTEHNPSVVFVARPNMATAFSDTLVPLDIVAVVDDPITFGPGITLGVIGNAQGLWASTGQDVLTLVEYMDFGFTQGELNGSSISMLSKNPISETTREVAVVGGRGKFRMAQGFAEIKTYFFNLTNSNAIVEYNVTVIHY
ncbi:dirigent protein 4-like [Hibiscus syriacus]|uniref:dirigent protein 4-like n=1 Tax=Hibiscus syriacus TaxID=106335 RepID=UPI001924D335|nr:dirigent protein 4-like [Hibiscus syriacus]